MHWCSETAPLYADGGYQIQTDYNDESPSLALLRAIAVIKNCEMRDLPSINKCINLEALNQIMAQASPSDHGISVEVNIDEYTAIVRDDGTITVTEDDSFSQPSEN